MRKELIILLIVVIAIAAWVWWPEPESTPKCPLECQYGCLPMTTRCKEPICPSTCWLGCIPGTQTCKQRVIKPEMKLIDACGVINESSELNFNLQSDKTCLTIQNDDLILDCKGHSITGGMEQDSFGIYLDGRRNITIKNCIIQNYLSGIFVSSSSDLSLLDLTADNNSWSGISISSSENIIVDGVSASNNRKSGIELVSSSNASLSNNQLNENSYGIIIGFSNGIGLLNNYICASSPINLQCEEADIVNEEGNVCDKSDGCEISCSPCSQLT